MAGPHDKIIADAAKSALGQLGFVRKGRSRTWIADYGWWATVIEFQPSAWSKGSYLNVAAHWLWSGEDHISCDFGGRIAQHVEYLSDEQFAPAIIGLAGKAAHEAQRLANLFTSLTATADILLNAARTTQDRYNQGGWMDYHAGVAAGLVGRSKDASEMFLRVEGGFAQSNSLLSRTARQMNGLLPEQEQFRREVVSLLERHRAALCLPELSAPPI